MNPRAVTSGASKVAALLFVVAGVLLVGWAIAAVVSWEHIVSSHARLGYLVGDVGLVVPLCLATGVGLRRATDWSGRALQFTLGALAYDSVHFAVFLAQEKFLGISLLGYLALLAAVLFAIWKLARWEYHRLTAP